MRSTICAFALAAIMAAFFICPFSSAGEFVQVFSAVADKPGLYGSYYQGDLRIMPVGCDEHPQSPPGGFCVFEVLLAFIPFNGDGLVFSRLVDGSFVPSHNTTPPHFYVENVLARIFEGEASGYSGVLVISANTEFRAFLRSYNVTEDGTFGHWVPAFDPLELGVEYIIPHEVDRTNLMLVNLGQDGSFKLGGISTVLDSNTAHSFIDIGTAGLICAGCPLNPPIVGLGVPVVYAIATTMDNNTNDPTTVPLWPIEFFEDLEADAVEPTNRTLGPLINLAELVR
ncbi:MAG: hypothetical protein GY906_11695 [bacterium]|nr:hypothetical protein [bacterium]